MRRPRRALAIVAVVLSLGGAMALAHSAPADDHTGQGIAVCRAAMGVGAAALTALAGRPPSAARALVPLGPTTHAYAAAAASAEGLPPPRAGAAHLEVFLR